MYVGIHVFIILYLYIIILPPLYVAIWHFVYCYDKKPSLMLDYVSQGSSQNFCWDFSYLALVLYGKIQGRIPFIFCEI